MKPDVQFQTAGETHTEAVGRLLGEVARPGDVVGLVGDLGAGKTCFARGVARGLAVDPRVHVSSPTFTLVNEYPGRLTLYHIDLYRLSDPDELVEVGFDAYTREDGLCLVEWFDRFPDERPAEHLELQISVVDDNTRRFVPTARGRRHNLLLQHWTRRIDDLCCNGFGREGGAPVGAQSKE